MRTYECAGRKPEEKSPLLGGGTVPLPHEFTVTPLGQVICRYCGRGPLK